MRDLRTEVPVLLNGLKRLDSGLHRNDGKRRFPTFYETIKFENMQILLEATDENKGGCFVSRGRLCGHQ